MYRRSNDLLFALILFLQIYSYDSAAQTNDWKGLTPFYGAATTCIAQHPNGKIFIGTTGDGLYSSDDNGLSWKQSWYYRTNLIVPHVGSIAIDKNGIIYFGIEGSSELFKSVDGGINWVQCNFSNAAIFCLTTNDFGELFVASKNGIYLSKDQGTSWTTFLDTDVILKDIVSNLDADVLVRNIVINKGIIYATIDQIGLIISKDNGISWSLSRLPQSRYLSVLVVNESEIYVALISDGFFLYKDGLFRSSDGGLTWSELSPGFKNRIYHVIQLNDGSILASVDNGKLLRTVDSGKNWTQINYGSIGTGVAKLFVSKNNVFACTYGAGVYVFDNSLSNWNYSISGFNKPLILEIHAIDNQNLFVRNIAGIFRFNVDTEKYYPLDGINDIVPMYFRILSNGSLLGLTYGGAIYKSNTIYGPWNKITTANKPEFIRMVSYPDSKTLFFYASGGEFGLYRSTDLGSTWSLVRNDFANCFSIIRLKNGTLLAGNSVWIYGSSDNGTTWEKVSDYIFSSIIQKLKIAADGSIYAVTQSHGLYRSDDNGKSWNKIFSSFCNDILISPDNSVLIATDKGTYKSSDKGAAWTESNNDLLSQKTNYLFESTDGRKYAVTNDQVFVNSIVTDVQGIEMPVSYSMMQNYPNPFNPLTTINYSLPISGLVSIRVYDLLGREIASLVNENKSAGSYSVKFDGSNLSSGVYYYRINAGEYSAVKKMILMK